MQGITANAIEVVIETGDCGPVTPIGINLPNDQDGPRAAREQVGLALERDRGVRQVDADRRSGREFAWSPEEVERAEKWSALAHDLLVNMHEVIGHASGRVSERLEGQPQDAIKEYYSALEEGRADLVALYYMPDPKLAELGLVAAEDQEEMARAAYEDYTRNALVQLRRVREGSQIEEDHMRNRQMVVRWLMDNTDAIDVRERDGKTFYVMTRRRRVPRRASARCWPRCSGSSRRGITRRRRSSSRRTASTSIRRLRDEVVAADRDARPALVHRVRHAELAGEIRQRGEVTDVR